LDARALAAAFGPQDDEAAQDEGGGHHLRREQMRLDRLAEQQPQHHGRQKTDQHVARKALRLPLVGSATSVSRIFCQYTMITARMAPVWMAMSNTLALASSKPSSARQDQVAGGRNGQKFGQTLDHAHDRRP
jgi:hypothetical protein